MNAEVKAGIKMRALCALAVSWLCACGSGRSALAPNEGAAGRATGGASATGGGSASGASGATGGASATGRAGATGGASATGRAGATGASGATGGAGAAGALDGGATDAAAGARGSDAAEAGGDATAGGSLTIATTAGCSKDGWCWSTPTPQGNPLYSIRGSSASDVWAVGESGAIVHWDGKSWSQVQSGAHVPLRGVWAAGASDAWAVGDSDTVLHWDGAAWSPPPVLPPTGFHWRGVWGTGPADLWLVGVDPSTPSLDGGEVVHWDGEAWTAFKEEQSLDVVWGTGPDDVWALGDSQGMFHWDGKLWTTVSTGALPQIGTAIWGASSSDLWLGSSDAGPSRWNGVTLDVGATDTSVYVEGLWGSGANDVWAVGETIPDLFVDGGLILHWDGLAWERLPSTGASHLSGIWGSRSDDIWAVGDSGDIVHWDGRTWSAPIGPPHVGLFSVWASASDDVWAFGYDRAGLGALRWNGQTWAKTEVLAAAAIGASAGATVAPYAAWGSGRDDIWVGVDDFEPIVGNPGSSTARMLFVHWDGHAWSPDATLDANLAASATIKAIWGSGPKDVWAVGLVGDGAVLTGVAVHWDGARWSSVTSLSPTELADGFTSVWSSGPNDVWIGGDKYVHHWDGISWTHPLSAEDGGGGFLIGGSGPSDIWAVSEASDGTSTVSHWNGLAWKASVVPMIDFPISVAASSPTNAWLVSDEAISHWDGTSWTPSDAGTDLVSSNLWWDGTEFWAIAGNGLIRHP